MNEVFTFFGNIFGTSKSKNQTIEVLDKAFFTDQERAEHRAEMLEKYVPFVLAQRFLAIGTFSMYAIYFFVFLIYTIFGGKTERLLDFAEATQIQNLFFAVMLFYFNSDHFRKILSKFGSNKDKPTN